MKGFSFLTTLAVLSVTVASFGCASRPVADTSGTLLPNDFSLDITVLVGRDAAKPVNNVPAMRPSRFVLFPDGRLHYGSDPQRGADWLPPARRTLSQLEMMQLWMLIEDEGLIADGAAGAPTNFKLIQPHSNEVVYLLMLSAHDGRRAIAHRASNDMPADNAIVKLIDELAELAWVEEEIALMQPLPQRYDFGPDPYALYR